jgi:20S proteasome alpha/beta subunit
VTIGIAAICRIGDDPFIVGAADRMLTAGDIEFEHSEPKVVPLAARIVAISAGDVAAHLTICSAARAEIKRGRVSEVAAAAEIVGAAYRDYRGRVAERRILAPLGLTIDTFFAHQRELAGDVASQVTRALADQTADVETIVAGVDEQGGHIYMIADPGQVTCYDTIGFAAIGNGSRHAASHLLQLGYTPRTSFPRAAVLVHLAKKRAEVAPGVGPATDGFGVGDRYYFPVSDELSERLTAICLKMREREATLLERAVEEFDEYVCEHVMPRYASAVSAAAPPTPAVARRRSSRPGGAPAGRRREGGA